MKLVIQQGRDQFEVSIPEGGKIEQVHEEVEKRNGIFKRRQKLIYKGKILLPHHDLVDSKVRPGQICKKAMFSGKTYACDA